MIGGRSSIRWLFDGALILAALFIGQPTNLKLPSHPAQSRKGGSSVSTSKILMLLLFVTLLFGTVKTASAQSADIYFDIGTAIDKSSGQTFDTFGDGNLHSTPKMTGLVGGIGGSFMLRRTMGLAQSISLDFLRAVLRG
jgi:hypothetical protein